MIKKLLIILCLLSILNPNIIKAEELIPTVIVEALENSTITTTRENEGHNININYENNILTITGEYNSSVYETIFEYSSNALTYSSNEAKEILKESTIWIEEITNIVLSSFNYDSNIINNLDLKNYTFESNGIEGVKNEYIENNEEIYYYFYYKINLNSINLENNNIDNNTNQDDNIDDNTNTITETDETNTEETIDTNTTNLSNYGLYIEIFCAVIAVIMLIINAATKSD